MTRSSRRTQKGVHIDLSEIKYDSSCISLGLPLELSCDNCKPKLEAQFGLGKKSSTKMKRSREFNSDRWKCQQLWQSKFGTEKRQVATVRKHVRVRNYLNIEQEVIINYQNEYNNGDTNSNITNIKKKEI